MTSCLPLTTTSQHSSSLDPPTWSHIGSIRLRLSLPVRWLLLPAPAGGFQEFAGGARSWWSARGEGGRGAGQQNSLEEKQEGAFLGVKMMNLPEYSCIVLWPSVAEWRWQWAVPGKQVYWTDEVGIMMVMMAMIIIMMTIW